MKENINDRYQLSKIIGEGGNATVYLALDTITNKQVAIKIMKNTIKENNLNYLRFQREAKTACTLIHPNIVKIFDIGLTSEEKPFVVMEYIRGSSVKELIKKRGYLDINEACDILIQVMNGLSYAHKYKIIHRDIKPQNILIKPDGSIIIADFGTSFILTDNKDDINMTQNNTIIGSPHYLAPEISRGEFPSIQSDIYALGISMYELLCGELPFNGKTPTEVAAKHITNEIPMISKINIKVPKSFENIILKATNKDLLKRYANINEFKADLLEALKEYNNPKKISFFKRIFGGKKK